MKRNFLPEYVGIALTKSQFCFCTGMTPYRLKRHLRTYAAKYQRLGLNRYDKLLMPSVVQQLLIDTGLRVDIDLYTQYVAGQRGMLSTSYQ